MALRRRSLVALAALLAGCVERDSPTMARSANLVGEAALQHALETMPSGTATTWQSSADEQFRTVVPVRTFRTRMGYCREYLVTLGGPGEDTSRWRDVACRDPAGVWRAFESGA